MSDNTLHIHIEQEGTTRSRSLALSEKGPWNAFLGAFPIPDHGAIDELDQLFQGQDAGRVTLSACPSACLLPMLWIRTIWCAHRHAEIVIDWKVIDDPSGAPRRQAAAKLACLLADRLDCADPDAAWMRWGIEAAEPRSAPQEAFDLLTNIVDLWDTDLERMTLASQWEEFVRRALLRCDALGHRRIAIYGAGTHTRAVGTALMDPGVEIVCIIDDDARRHGDRMWGYPIVSRQHALTLDLDAVIISANSIEHKLWDKAQSLRDRGIATLRLYGRDDDAIVLPLQMAETTP